MLVVVSTLILTACQTRETHRSIEPEITTYHYKPFKGTRYNLVIGKFENKSNYMRGIFYEKDDDRLGFQAKQILKTHLSMTNRFNLLDRDNMAMLADESGISGQSQNLMGGEIVVSGAVTEFGRKQVGSAGLGGLLSESKTQIAYCKVSLSVINVKTSQVLYSSQGAGEFDLTNEHVLGFGSTAGYDATLADKVLNLAMLEAVNHLVDGLESGAWSMQ